MDLSGTWSLSDARGDHALEIELPCDVITALERAGRIPDPYHGRNEYGLRWIAERDWTLRRRVTLTDPEVALVLSGVDCVATVRVNGRVVLETANAFRGYRADLGGVAQAGENEIEIVLQSSVAAAEAAQQAQPFPVPYHKANCPIPNGNMLRKVQCDFGWDWNIALAPAGIYGDIRIEPARAPRVTGLTVTQDHEPGHVTVTVAGEATDAEGRLCLVSLAAQSVEAPVTDGRFEARIGIDDPQLWWPAGQGAQVLHDLTVTLGGTSVKRRIGLRSLDLVSEPDEIGRSFGFRVNGRDVFARGANWIPADALPGRITKEKTRHLLQSAVDAHMNMIRVWGGGRYEPDWFYDLCDELGLMVWQDFMFACHLYPSTPEFLDEVAGEVRETVARLQHHASIALWCGDNELIGALTWFPESVQNRDRYLVSYDRLNRTIEAALRETAPGANWWPSSPSPGPMSFGDAWHDDSAGDMHFWSVWHEGRDFDHYRDVAPRFCSEFGFQSYPSMSVIRQFADPADFNIASPVLESHQKNAGGNARIAETMFRYFRFPKDFESFVYLSQVQQGLAIRTAVEHWRSLKPRCKGTLYWQLNDTWPVCSWSSLDYGGGWKLMHHMARRFHAPVHVVAVPEGEQIVLKAVNDTGAPVAVEVTAEALFLDGRAETLAEAGATVGPDAALEVLRVQRAALGEARLLGWAWRHEGGAGAEHSAPRPYKAYGLLPPGIGMRVAQVRDAWEITLDAAALALFVSLEADRPGRFSDNAVTLIPGRPVTITFRPETNGPEPAFTLRDLHGATMAA
ncbi:glycoside hydrolase family 2 protein [Histidinibacterium lentulum]|uniref:beta-mannosidase n=1 Tax=Histidinibacterium lentulum TaxID=2480588 RepID=A0A3N2RAC2_9RHOB|nr:glycoside hydrolase family 2 protein [Histidinibacterium lentulum]